MCCVCDACDLKGVLYELTLKYWPRLLERTLKLTHKYTLLLLTYCFLFPTITIDFLRQKENQISTQTHPHTDIRDEVQFKAKNSLFFYMCTMNGKCFSIYTHYAIYFIHFSVNVSHISFHHECWNSFNLCFDSNKRSSLRV